MITSKLGDALGLEIKDLDVTKISDKKMELCKTCGVFVAKDLAIFEGKSIYCSKKCINLK